MVVNTDLKFVVEPLLKPLMNNHFVLQIDRHMCVPYNPHHIWDTHTHAHA